MKRLIPIMTLWLLSGLLALQMIGFVPLLFAQQVPFPFPGRGNFPGRGPGPGPFLVPKPPPPQVIDPEFPLKGGAFQYPVRIDQTESGWLLVTDPKRKAVLKVDPGTLKADQALPLLDKPLSVGVLGSNIYVGLEEKQVVAIFSLSGLPNGFLASPGQVGFPTDLSIDRGAGLVFVLDGADRDIKVFDAAARTYLGSLGKETMILPTGIAVDPAREEVLVSDYGSSGVAASVKIFSYATGTAGSLVAEISGAGNCTWFRCEGGFSRPRGLAVHNARIYVTDVIYGHLLVFDRETLAQVGSLGGEGTLLLPMRVPSDVVIQSNGDVFATSSLTQQVVKFPGGAL